MCCGICNKICEKLKPIKFLILQIVNVNQLINSMVMMIFGASVKTTGVFEDYLEENDFTNAVGDLKAKAPVSMVTSESEFDNTLLQKLLEPMGQLMITIGVVCLAVSVFGIAVSVKLKCIMKCLPKKHKFWRVIWMLFAIVSGVMGTATFLALFWKKMVIESVLQTYLPEYGGIKATDDESMIFNTIMLGFQCCGVNGYFDFGDSEKWPPKNPDFDSITLIMNVTDKRYMTPVACCSKPELIEYGCFMEGVANDMNNNMASGCVAALTETASSLMASVTGILVWITITCGLSMFACLIFYFAGPPPPPEEPSQHSESGKSDKSSKSEASPSPKSVGSKPAPTEVSKSSTIAPTVSTIAPTVKQKPDKKPSITKSEVSKRKPIEEEFESQPIERKSTLASNSLRKGSTELEADSSRFYETERNSQTDRTTRTGKSHESERNIKSAKSHENEKKPPSGKSLWERIKETAPPLRKQVFGSSTD